MGLDMYLGKYHKTNLEKKTFNVKETMKLKNDYTVFEECPVAFENIATEVKIVNQYLNMEKISEDFADGNPLTIGGFGGGNIYLRNYEEKISLDIPFETLDNGYYIDKEENAYVISGEYEIAYWRKANQIRHWFVNHIEEFKEDHNGGYYTITKELLEELIEDCNSVLTNHDMAEDILPTSSGFFFGSTRYDEWYYNQLENTIDQCERVINETDWENEVIVYHESW